MKGLFSVIDNSLHDEGADDYDEGADNDEGADDYHPQTKKRPATERPERKTKISDVYSQSQLFPHLVFAPRLQYTGQKQS